MNLSADYLYSVYLYGVPYVVVQIALLSSNQPKVL